MFWFVCRKVVLFPALLQRKELFFQFSASHPDFDMSLLKRTFLLVFGLVTMFKNSPSENKFFLFSRNQMTLLTLYSTKKMFWFVGN